MRLHIFNSRISNSRKIPGPKKRELGGHTVFFYFLREINISFLFTIPGPFLQSFFDSTKGVFKSPQVQAWDKRLRDIRNQLFLNV